MMASSQQIPEEILAFGDRCARALSRLNSPESCIEYGREALPELLLNRELLSELMQNMVSGERYPDIRRPTMFDNEVVLFLHPEHLFSLRLYLWGSGDFTYPHDHNSWGVIGTATDGYEVTNYRRLDDGSVEGHARLEELETLRLGPGETSFTLPFNRGIHKTGNGGDRTIITLHFYGRSLARGYLQGFDVANDRVYRILPPRMKKRTLAEQALETLGKPHDSL